MLVVRTSARMRLSDARSRFFARWGFGADGGYEDAWATAAFGPLEYTVPNLPARVDALRRHDLHHLVTGYDADWQGEAEISAWEIGSGLGPLPYAWLIALWGLFTGLALPSRSLRAFARGRRSSNLYRRRLPDLSQDVALLKRDLGVPSDAEVAPEDVLGWGLWSAFALSLGLLALPFAGLFVGVAALQKLMPECTVCTC